MKLVFISSPLSSNDPEIVKKNQENARKYCRFAVSKGYACIASHIFYTQFLDDSNSVERKLGLEAGIETLLRCDEMWIFADDDSQISKGMNTELDAVIAHNTIGNNKIIAVRQFTTECKERSI